MLFDRWERKNYVTRRACLQATGVAAWNLLSRDLHARPLSPDDEKLRAIDLDLPGDRTVARKARVLVSKDSSLVTSRTPLLILLHGLGETGHEGLALRAWPDLYGLRSSVARLMNPPVRRTLNNKDYLSDARLVELNHNLSQTPFVPPIFVCPVTPRPSSHASRTRLFDQYAEWIEAVLLPEVRKRVPNAGTHVGLDGCSMGGYVASEVFVRRPRLFQGFGMVQSAIASWRVADLAKRVAGAAQISGSRLRIASSSADPFRQAAEQLSAELREHGVPHSLSVTPGPHDQNWLREVGTLDVVDWHVRQVA